MRVSGWLQVGVGALLLASVVVRAEEAGEGEIWEEHPHHLSVLLAGTYEDEDGESETSETVGIDYEYRLDPLLGIGVVVERAFDPLDATTVLAVGDFHAWRGLAVQAGAGVEFIDGDGEEDDEDLFVVRLGTLYELEFGHFTLSPQLHYDVTEDTEAIVFGVALGFAF